MALSREFYARDAREVAPRLLNQVLVRRGADGQLRSGRIVEVEAYVGDGDPASHAAPGRTARNALMFGPPGHLYVYFSYGMHWCANAVCDVDGRAAAVLLRALAPVEGVEAMWAARPAARRERDLCSGPAKLCQALGITGDDKGADLVTGAGGVSIVADGVAPPEHPVRTGRVGISVGVEHLWRWYVPAEPNVSRR